MTTTSQQWPADGADDVPVRAPQPYAPRPLAAPFTPVVTWALLAVMVAVFLWQQTSDTNKLQVLVEGALYPEAINAGHWWQLVTPAFLHADFIHIGFNGYLLYQLGPVLEQTLGRRNYALVFFGAVLGGSVGALVLQGAGTITVGASGGVFGLFGALAVMMLLRGKNPMSTSIGPLIVLNLIFTFVGDNISIGGHIGGLLLGALLGFVIVKSRDVGRAAAGQTTALVINVVLVFAGIAAASAAV